MTLSVIDGLRVMDDEPMDSSVSSGDSGHVSIFLVCNLRLYISV